MENKVVIGILDIVEDKLREFGVVIPDDVREDSKDPIVGYQYAELHDRIQEYLEGEGLLKDPNQQEINTKIHAVSIVNSESWMRGREANVNLYPTLNECMVHSYNQYLAIMDEIAEEGLLEPEDTKPMSLETYCAIMLGDRCLNIQLPDYHIQFEYFEKDLTFRHSYCIPNKEQTSLDTILTSAESRTVSFSQKNVSDKGRNALQHR